MVNPTQESDTQKPILQNTEPPPKSHSHSHSHSHPHPARSMRSQAGAFQFWLYVSLIVSLITLFSIFLRAMSPQDPKTWFLNLPPILRDHYSNGRTIKVQTAPNQPEVEIFAIQKLPSNADSRVLIVHGVGCTSFSFQGVVKFLGQRNVHALAIDLPGSGFSDKSSVVIEESVGEASGVFARVREVFEDIRKKGLFWGFDQLVEQGYVNFEENKVRYSKKESIRPIEFGGEEMGRVLGQVVDAMGLAPVDLVLHDSALGLSANWISEHRGLIRSVVLVDSAPTGAALPLWLYGMPVVKEIVLGSSFVFQRVLASCCMTSVGTLEAEAHRVLLKGRDWGSTVFRMGKKLNTSFDLSEWGSRDEVKGLPIQVIWSEKWLTEGSQIAAVLPQATVGTHSGGRWIQEHNSEELAEHISDFIFSLPQSTRKIPHVVPPESSCSVQTSGESCVALEDLATY